jgi:hypothetical protein
MSLFATDEENAYYDGRANGMKDGYKKAIFELKNWLENDSGMIAVSCIRDKLNVMDGDES